MDLLSPGRSPVPRREGSANAGRRSGNRPLFDFFQGTDLWYEAIHDPAAGWSMRASRIVDGAIVPMDTDARIVVEGAAVYAIVPIAELGTDCPHARLTAFAHGGDFGLQPPYEWSGDTELPVDQPLIAACR